jgi:hypothetical protein
MSKPLARIQWGMKTLVGILSELLNAELRLAGFPTLTDGGIVIGSLHETTRTAPPRIVFTPAASTFGGVTYQAEPPDANPTIQPLASSVATDFFTFDAHIWAAAYPPDANGGDLDAARFLMHQLIRVCQPRIHSDTIRFGRAQWDPEPVTSLGQKVILPITFATPVVDPAELYLPPGIVGQITIENDVPEVSVVINLPGSA